MRLKKVVALLFALVILGCSSQAIFAKNYVGGGIGLSYGYSTFGIVPNVEVTYDINRKFTIDGFAGVGLSFYSSGIKFLIYADAALKWNALNFQISNLGNITLGLQGGAVASIGFGSGSAGIGLGLTAGVFADWKINPTWRVYASSAFTFLPLLPKPFDYSGYGTHFGNYNTSVVGVQYNINASSALRGEFRYFYYTPIFVVNYGMSF